MEIHSVMVTALTPISDAILEQFNIRPVLATVTRIHITDPEITVYGLTMNSTNTEIEDRMADRTDEFHYSEVNDVLHISFNVGKCVFDFSSTDIDIAVPPTNKQGIIY